MLLMEAHCDAPLSGWYRNIPNIWVHSRNALNRSTHCDAAMNGWYHNVPNRGTPLP